MKIVLFLYRGGYLLEKEKVKHKCAWVGFGGSLEHQTIRNTEALERQYVKSWG